MVSKYMYTYMDIRMMYTLWACIHACAEAMHIQPYTIVVVTYATAEHTHIVHKVMWHWSCIHGCGLYTHMYNKRVICMHNYVTWIVIHAYTWHDMTWLAYMYTWVCTWWNNTIVIHAAQHRATSAHTSTTRYAHVYVISRWYMHAWPYIQ